MATGQSDSLPATGPPERDELEIDLRHLVATVLERWYWVVGVVGAAIVLALLYIVTTDPVYEAKAELLVDPGAAVRSNIGLDPAVAGQRMSTRIAVIESPQVLDRAAEILEGQGHPAVWAAALGESGVVRASSLQGVENVIDIRVRAPLPSQAVSAAAAVAQAYVRYSQDAAQIQASMARLFLEEQIARTERELSLAEAALRDFRRSSGIISLEDEASRLNEQLRGLESEHSSTTVAIAARRFTFRQVEHEIESRRQQLPETAGGPSAHLIEALQSELADLETQVTDLRARGLSQSAPEIGALDRRILGLRDRLQSELSRLAGADAAAVDGVAAFRGLQLQRAELESEIETLENQAALLQQEIQAHQNELRALSESGYQLSRLERNVEVASNTDRLLRAELERARLAEASELSLVRILRSPELPRAPIRPRPFLTLAVATVLGGFAGVGATLLLSMLDNRVKTSKDLERIGLGVLGTVGVISDTERPETAVRGRDGADPLVRAYVRIDGNLRFSNVDEPARVITVTSALPSQGKSTTVSNLGMTLARGGERVLIVDCDMDRPAIHEIFDVSRVPGLTEWVAGRTAVDQTPRVIVREGGGQLDVLPAGSRPPSIATIFRSDRFGRWLDEVRGKYDWVLIDAAPALVVPEVLSLVRRTDGAVIVVKAHEASVQAVWDAAVHLRGAGGQVLGAILNQARAGGHSYERDAYRYYGALGGHARPRRGLGTLVGDRSQSDAETHLASGK